MLNSVKFNDIDLYTQYGCVLAHLEIGVPKAQTKYIQIPLRNGSIDFTEQLTGDVRYEDRPIKIQLMYAGNNLLNVFSALQNFIHGKRFKVVFDEDASYYYEGRFTVADYSVTKYGGLINIEGTCNPFKYLVTSTIEEWLWDPFDFEEGYINELTNIRVNGTTTVTLIAEAKGYAKITSSATMNVTYDGKTVKIPAGTTTMYDFEFTAGEVELTFTGNGIVSVDYRGGRL